MTKILIEVEDGAVTAVHSDEKADYLDVMILDHDAIGRMTPEDEVACVHEYNGAVSHAGILKENGHADIHVKPEVLPYRIY